MYDFAILGAIVLIIKKVQPAYSLILGALIGGIIGGDGLVTTVNTMVSGASSMMSSVLLIMTSGILAGALIKTGGSVKMSINERMKLIPYEALVGLTSTILAVIWYLI